MRYFCAFLMLSFSLLAAPFIFIFSHADVQMMDNAEMLYHKIDLSSLTEVWERILSSYRDGPGLGFRFHLGVTDIGPVLSYEKLSSEGDAV